MDIGDLFDVERKIGAVCYHCDLCRMEIHSFEYSFHCQCDMDGEHDFCVSCTHSIFMQYQEMKPFLATILKTQLNDNCIEEIVAFCIGKVNRYAVEPAKSSMAIVEEDMQFSLEQKMSELAVS